MQLLTDGRSTWNYSTVQVRAKYLLPLSSAYLFNFLELEIKIKVISVFFCWRVFFSWDFTKADIAFLLILLTQDIFYKHSIAMEKSVKLTTDISLWSWMPYYLARAARAYCFFLSSFFIANPQQNTNCYFIFGSLLI